MSDKIYSPGEIFPVPCLNCELLKKQNKELMDMLHEALVSHSQLTRTITKYLTNNKRYKDK